MADVLDPTGVSWCGQQATEVLIKPTFLTPEIESMVDVLINIKSRRQLALDGILEDVIQTSTGCGRDPSDEVIQLTEKYLELCDAKINLDQCAKGVNDTFMEEWLRTGNDIYDITGTKIADYIIEKVQNAMRIDLFKILWFGDVNSSDQVLKVCTGLWTRFIQAVDSYNMTRAYVFSDELAECDALEALRALWAQQSTLLKSQPMNMKYLAVTSSVYENYRTCLEERCCGDRGTILLEDGRERLTFRGMTLIEVTEWDRIIANKGLAFPHRALLTLKDNLKLGTDAMSDLNSLEIIYNPYEKNNQIDAEFRLGTQYAYDELTIVAY